MIPVSLTLKGFLSYREKVSLDFTSFEMACVIGHNGAGKSSLLDAITWALFGKARSSDDDLIHMQEDAAEVNFVFDYENQRYEVSRSKKRRSSKVMNLQMLNDDTEQWVSLSEATVSDTQSKLEHILMMDYDTFINASFFLQGQADQFAQQRPAERKNTLAKILELDIWETYQQKAAEVRKERQTRLTVVNQWLTALYEDLGQEEELKKRQVELEGKLVQLEEISEAQGKVAQTMRRQREQAVQQQDQVRMLKVTADSAQKRLENHSQSIAQNIAEKTKFVKILSEEKEILARMEEWKRTRVALEAYEALAKSFNDLMLKRSGPFQVIRETEIRLQGQLKNLDEKHQAYLLDRENLAKTEEKLAIMREEQKQVIAEVSQFPQMEDTRDHLVTVVNEIEVDRKGIHREMAELSDRITKLESIDTAYCPVCGQTLEEDHRKILIKDLRVQGHRLNQSFKKLGEDLPDYTNEIERLGSEIQRLKKLETEKLSRGLNVSIASLEENQRRISESIKVWEDGSSEEYQKLKVVFSEGQFASEAREELAQIDNRLKELGYDSAEHEELRARELSGRTVQQEFQSIENAKSALAPLERMIDEQEKLKIELDVEAVKALEISKTAEEQLEALMVDENDYRVAYQKWQQSRDGVNLARQELGGAQQSISALTEKRNRKIELEQEREEIAQEIDRYKLLEEAFSQKGIPALLIEQAIPEIEEQANEILSQLSTTGMMVQFRTQRAYKDKKRKDKRETLDIIISDNAGERNYEMYSGGEAFRVNFAIRLALSKMLAARAGARLQTLVIDEGFGSQDREGVQRLVEAINLIKNDFAKIIVITHLDTLKESFPAQIEVSKSSAGSHIEVYS